jgi:hypothetical protein
MGEDDTISDGISIRIQNPIRVSSRAKMTQLVMGLASEFKIASELAVIGVKTTQLVMGLASELVAVGAKMTQLAMGLASELAAVSEEDQASGPTHPVESMMMTRIHRHVDINE